MIESSDYNWIGWIDIKNKPPNNIHILVYIQEWGPAVGRLCDDNLFFIFNLPHEDSEIFLEIPITQITHWHPIPELLESK